MPWESKPGDGCWWAVERVCCGAEALAVFLDESRFYIPHETSCPYHRWRRVPADAELAR